MLKSIPQNLLEKVFSDAYDWLKKSRKHYPDSSDIWDFRRRWKTRKEGTIRLFLHGSYHFDVQERIRLSNNETVALWSSRDALILKVLTCLIQTMLRPVLSRNCYHLKGNGGLKGAVRKVLECYPKYRFFLKTDVKEYYDSIDHNIILTKLQNHIRDRTIIFYVWQFLARTVEWGGLYRNVKQGIARGSSLSPLLGALYLIDLDKRVEKMDIQYFRYMDDILILAPTRWKLKKAIKILNQTFKELKLEKHPDKTKMGRIERGFDFLGYRFSPQGLSVAEKSIQKFLSRAIRLNEQEQREPSGPPLLELYVIRWSGWAGAGLSGPAFHIVYGIHDS